MDVKTMETTEASEIRRGHAAPAGPRLIERITDRERKYVAEVLDNGFCMRKSTKMVSRLETAFADRFGVKNAVAQVNGTATLHSALVAAGVGPGDEVIVPPLTMAATSLAVLHAGARPVFADVDDETFNIDPASIRERVTPRTRAIMPVALYGLAPDMDAIMAIARENDLMVIEDAAQCFLGYYKGQLVGTIGDLGSFSFQSTKHMTSGEGGMVVSNSPKLSDRVRQFSSLGYATAVSAGARLVPASSRQDPNFVRHTTHGWNYRMSDVCAGVALGQLEHLDELVEMRIAVARLFIERLADCSWLVAQKVPDDCVNAYWTLAVRLAVPEQEISRKAFAAKFQEYGGEPIYAAWKLTYLEPLFQELDNPASQERLMYRPADGEPSQRFEAGLCPVAERVQPGLLQFKTNYYDLDIANRQADALAKAIAYFQ
jgi:perosamine synthetase